MLSMCKRVTIHGLRRSFSLLGEAAGAPAGALAQVMGHNQVQPLKAIAGAHGVGKTTALLPLALTAAGLHGDDLMPRQWRHVVDVTEDVEQARRKLAGMTGYSNIGIILEQIRERVDIVEAVRLDTAFVASVGKTYREEFRRVVDGVEVLPLVNLRAMSDDELSAYIKTTAPGLREFYAAVVNQVLRHPSTFPVVREPQNCSRLSRTT